MSIARTQLKCKFPHAKVDFELHMIGNRQYVQTWFVYDVESGFLLSLGCKDVEQAWKRAYANMHKVVAQIHRANVNILPR